MTSNRYDDVRVLVLGVGARAERARNLLNVQGASLASTFDPTVTYVVVDRSVPANDTSVAAARRHAVPVLTTVELQDWPGLESLADVAAPPPPSGPAQAPVAYRPIRPQLPVPGGDVNPSLGWALACIFTGGFATPAVIGHAAQRLQSKWAAVAAGAYGLALAAICLSIVGSGGFGVVLAVSMLAWLGVWGGGAVHAYLLGQQVREKHHRELLKDHSKARPTPETMAKDDANAAALAEVEHQRTLRRKARQLLADNRVAARSLRIGRPDLPRNYDDGGLVDVNHAPIEVLLSMPGVTAEVAQELVDYRDAHNGFESMSDVVVHTSINPRLVDEFEEMALFLP